DRAGQVADGAGELIGPGLRHAVVADREVDVAEAEAAGPLDVGPGAVHRNDRADPEPLQRTEAGVVLGAAAAVEPAGDAEDVVQAGQVEPGRLIGGAAAVYRRREQGGGQDRDTLHYRCPSLLRDIVPPGAGDAFCPG